MKNSKRKIRSDKFPLTLLPTGQYCKKIKGKICYFGTDKKKALEKYLAHATYLHGAYPSVDRQNLHIGLMKAMFHWTRKNDALDSIPNIDAISKERIVGKEKYTFNPQQIRKLLSTQDLQMKAMIWLDLNCCFGCNDCSRLKREDLDFNNNRVKLPKNKTGVGRNLPL
jgi:integrase